MLRTAAPLLAALLVCTYMGEAAACLDFGSACQDLEIFTGAFALHTEHIPIDGVLLVEVTGPDWMVVTPAQVELQITLEGMPIAGALEDIGVAGVLAWRPAAPLVPLATYVVTGTVHNDSIPPGLEMCGTSQVSVDFEFTTSAGVAPPLLQPGVVASEELLDSAEQAFDNLVCCDGAFPSRPFSGCGPGGDIEFTTGFCTPLTTTRRLHVALKTTLELPPNSAPMITATLVVDGEPEPARSFLIADLGLEAQGSKPLCTEIILRDLTSGATLTTPKQCHGQDLADQLGAQVLAPDAPVLAERCMGAPYTCEKLEFDEAWDPARCTPWPVPDEPSTGAPTTGADPTTGLTGSTGETQPGADGLVEHGCSCASGPSAPAGLLVALCALGWRRRERRAAPVR